MAAKPLTTEAIAMTEKKMDMALDDIIKMSSTSNTKAKKPRFSNRNQKFLNNVVHNRSMKVRQFMDTRSTLRQGALAQRRSSFQGNQFPLAAEAAKKAAIAPIRNKNYNRTHMAPMYKPRFSAPPVQNGGTRGGFAVKQQVKVVLKQRPQTLDSLFANMKEQRMKQNNNNNNRGRRNGSGHHHQQQQHRPRPPWARFNN